MDALRWWLTGLSLARKLSAIGVIATAVSLALAGAVLLAVGLAYAGYSYFQGRKPYEWSGTVEAHTIKVGSRVGGRVKSVLVREGQRVKEGEPLVELEPGDLEAQRLVAEGALEQAQATLEKLEKGARPEEIEQAKARAATATAALEQWRAGARKEEISAAEARLLAVSIISRVRAFVVPPVGLATSVRCAPSASM